MRILILSCNTGAGHNSAGLAIKNYFYDRNISCEMTDALAFISKKASKVISEGHVFIYRKFPRLFGLAYEREDARPGKVIYKSMRIAAPSLYRSIREQGYDTVICTHVFSAMMMTEIKKRYSLDINIKTYFVATDYTCSPGVGDLDVDAFFIPHAALCDEFIKKAKTPREKLVPSGIPIRDDFFSPVDKARARKALHLPENAHIVLLTCGSMGAGPMRKLAKTIIRGLEPDSYLVVVCGTNHQLMRRISKATEKYPNIRVVGYTLLMKQYMTAADLFITKPGGLSTTEAFYRRLPMIVINAVPGCETHNMNFCLQHGLAETANSTDGIAKLAISRLADKEYLERVSKNMEELFPGNTTADICEYIINNSQRIPEND